MVIGLAPSSVHLVHTPPPCWTLIECKDSEGQMGYIDHYNEFLRKVDKVNDIKFILMECKPDGVGKCTATS